MSDEIKLPVQLIEIEPDFIGQRIDNFLLARLKGVPKSVIYRVLRKGEVRVNKKRIKPEYKLQQDDVVRIPPLTVAAEGEPVSVKLSMVKNLEQHILFEDNDLIVLNKPSGMAVHGGSGISFNWALLTPHNSRQPIMLAGGLNSDNCLAAARLPVAGLDFNSGLETAPGIKDAAKIRSAFTQLREFHYE